MNEVREMKNGVMAFIIALLFLLGLSLGASITCFVLFLNNNEKVLSVIAYFCLILFVLFLLVFGGVFLKERDMFFKERKNK